MDKIRRNREVRIFRVMKGDLEIGYYRKLVMVSDILGIPVTRLRNWGSRTKYMVRFYHMKYEVIPCVLVDGWYYEDGMGDKIKRVRKNLADARSKKVAVKKTYKEEKLDDDRVLIKGEFNDLRYEE